MDSEPDYRVPPQDLEAEEATLGAMMISKDAIIEVREILGEQHFYRESHRKLFQALITLHDRNEAIDIITMSNELKRMGEFDTIGGISALTGLLERVPTAANVEYYANIVKSKAESRKIISVCSQHMAEAYEDHLPPQQIAENMMGELVKWETVTKDFVDPITLSRTNINKMLNGENKRYIPTGFSKFDASMGGIRMGHLGVITGPGQQRKSTFMSNVAVNIAKTGHKISHLILEDDLENVQARQICILNDINFQSFTSDDEAVMRAGPKLTAYDKWSKLGIRMGDKFHTGQDWAKIKLLLMREVKKHGTDIIFIEGAEHLGITPRWGESIHDCRARMVLELDNMAQEFQIPIWCIVGKSKSEESKKAGGTNAWFTIPRQNIHIVVKNDLAEIEITKTNDQKEVKKIIQYEPKNSFRMIEL